MDVRGSVKLRNLVQHYTWLDVGRVGVFLGMETGLGAGIDFVAHIHLRRRILSNQNDRQPGSHSLRGEFVSFLKKDLREIDYVVSDINDQGSKDEFAANALELIKDTYIKHWERSFELISPDDLLKKPGEQK